MAKEEGKKKKKKKEDIIFTWIPLPVRQTLHWPQTDRAARLDLNLKRQSRTQDYGTRGEGWSFDRGCFGACLDRWFQARWQLRLWGYGGCKALAPLKPGPRKAPTALTVLSGCHCVIAHLLGTDPILVWPRFSLFELLLFT